MEIGVKKIGKDNWGRDIYINLLNHKRYKMVNGWLYTVTSYGEPNCPLREDLLIFNNEDAILKNFEDIAIYIFHGNEIYNEDIFKSLKKQSFLNLNNNDCITVEYMNFYCSDIKKQERTIYLKFIKNLVEEQ